MKYFFITCQATYTNGDSRTWNQVINTTPMAFIKSMESVANYFSFVILNTLEISKEEYTEYQGFFNYYNNKTIQ